MDLLCIIYEDLLAFIMLALFQGIGSEGLDLAKFDQFLMISSAFFIRIILIIIKMIQITTILL